MLLIEPSGTKFNEILIEIDAFSFKEMHLNISSAKWRSFCPWRSVGGELIFNMAFDKVDHEILSNAKYCLD